MIDPENPDFLNTPVSDGRPRFDYAAADPTAPPCASVVTAFFNAGEIFHETARSLLGQSLQQWEWIIVNDASTDAASLAILKEYRARDPRIRVVDLEENKGPSAARNAGIAAARTEYILLLDADDLIEPTALEKCVWFLESHPECGFVGGYSVGFGCQEYLWTRGFHSESEFLDANVTTITSALRRSVHQAVGGYDESIVRGMEDWDFWLRCADRGHWGATIPEFLDWYRRRADDQRPWEDIDGGKRQRNFRELLRKRYPRLFNGGFPKIARQADVPFPVIRSELPFHNRLEKSKPRVLMVLPWLTMGGADKFNRDLLDQLLLRGREVSIATTLEGAQPWLPNFTRRTPDVFVLPNFLKRRDYPMFLRYLIQSRRPDVVLLSNSELGYLVLPYLRTVCPEPAYVDFCHMEEDYWKNGGYPRYAAARQCELDLNIVSSNHVKEWMVDRGADPGRVEVCYTNQDPDLWAPAPETRARIRDEHDIPDETPVLLYAGRLCRQKKPNVFAHVMRHLVRERVEFQALVAGHGEDEPWLRSYLAEHDLEEHVIMLGRVPSEAMPGLMAASDLFFLPSLWEGIALSIYEAMSVGLAIVGADVGGQRELVTPECGVLIAPGDDDSEAERYSALLIELLCEPERIREMGRRGRERIAADFRLEHMGDRMVALLELAQRNKAARRPGDGDQRRAHETAALAVEYLRTVAFLDQVWKERQELHAWRESQSRQGPRGVIHGRAPERANGPLQHPDADESIPEQIHLANIRALKDDNQRLRMEIERFERHPLYRGARRVVGKALRRIGWLPPRNG